MLENAFAVGLIRKAGRVIVVELFGDLVGPIAAGALRTAVDSLIADGERYIVLNFQGDAGVLRINSSGVGELTSIFRALEKLSGRLALADPSKFVKNKLMICGLSKPLNCYDTEKDAVESFGPAVEP